MSSSETLGTVGRANRGTRRGLWLIRFGLWLYDLYSQDRSLPRHRTHRVGDPGTPQVDSGRYRWLASYSDAQMLYPERFVVALVEDARRAAASGHVVFQVFTHHQVRLGGPLAEVYREDETSNPVLRLRPSAIVNATGAWGDLTLQQLGVPSERLFGGTKGSHFLTRNERLKAALGGNGVYAEAPDGRLVFVLPAGESVLVGTTEVPFAEPPDRAVATPEEIDYLLQMARSVFPDARLEHGDVDMHYSGVRPLPYSDEMVPGAVTREHHVVETELHGTPVLTLVGGKLTTCRSFGETTADRILERLGVPRIADTRERIVPGGEDYPTDDDALRNEWERLSRQFHIATDAVEAIWSLVGTRTEEIVAAFPAGCEDRFDGTPLPVAFARWVIRNEWVTTLEDLVERRLMLLYHPRLTRRCLEQLAGLLVETGLLPASDVESCVDATRARLRRYYGKRVVE